MKNPIIEKAIERFDDLTNHLFLKAHEHKISLKEWNDNFAPILRNMRDILTEPFK